jgi:hypothetical protein
MVQVQVHRCLSHGEGHIRQGGDCYNMCTTSVTIGHVISGWDGLRVGVKLCNLDLIYKNTRGIHNRLDASYVRHKVSFGDGLTLVAGAGPAWCCRSEVSVSPRRACRRRYHDSTWGGAPVSITPQI